jgi:tetratricopeptide (TPR) repeat protein
VAAAHGWLAQILVERGAIDEAAELLDTAESTVAPDAFSRAPLLRARALVEAARGDHRAALTRALELGASLAAFGHTNPPASYPAWRSLAALEHHALGETQEALALAREEVELARAWAAPRTLGRALRSLGLIEGGDKGIELIREAVAVLAPSPARLEHAYALTNLGAFGVIALLGSRERANDDLRDYAGLWYTHPALATLMTFFLLSLGGFPPTAGFIAKWYIFSAAIGSGYYGLAIIGVLSSVVSVFFYLRIGVMMYMTDRDAREVPPPISRLAMGGLVVAMLGVLYLGVLPSRLIELAQQSIGTIF